MDSQEWLSGNARHRFPFAENSADASGIDLDALSEWVSDLRIFVSPYEEVDCWISGISWIDSPVLTLEGEWLTIDSLVVLIGQALGGLGIYLIEFSNPTGVIARMAFPVEEVVGTSNFHEKRVSFDGPIVAVLTPGKGWDDKASIGVDAGTPLVFATPQEIESTRIHPTNVNTDIRSFKGFILTAPYYDSLGSLIEVDDEVAPAHGERPAVAFNRIRSGYNIRVGQDGDFLDLDLVPGAGDGLYPCQEVECKPKVRTINQLEPNDQGNITLEFADCLRHSGRTDIDLLTGLPNQHGIKIYSDCLPCCTCSDYNNVSLSISRMSAKFKEINSDMNNVLLYSQEAYDEAVVLINASSPGLASIYKIELKADQICISIINNANVPIYAVLGITVTPLGDFALEPGQAHVMTGIHASSPPLPVMPPSNQDTGITDINDVDGWIPRTNNYTIGYGDPFGPIPPATITTICFFSASARQKLEDLKLICAKLQIFLGGDLGQGVLDADVAYQALLTEFTSLSIISAPCLDTAGFPAGDEGYDDRYGCIVETQADSILRQEIRDKLLARKYELAFDLEICGTSVMTAEMATLIIDLRALSNLVDASCKDGSYTCVDEDPRLTHWKWKCESAVLDDSGLAQVRNQNVARSEIYLTLDVTLAEQMLAVNEALADCLGEGMMADLFDTLGISLAAIFSNTFGCKATSRDHDIDREESTISCIDRLMSVVASSTTSTPP